MELHSPRLRLRLLAPSELGILLAGHPAAGERWAEGYPMDGTLVTAAMLAEQHERGVPTVPFGLWQAIRREDGVVIGGVSFHAPPDDLGEVSIGFGIVPSQRRRGYGAEVLRTLLTWALAQPEVRSVHADTDLVNLASQRLLARVGMVVVADEGDRKLFEITAPSGVA